jgi:hypothetical protein
MLVLEFDDGATQEFEVENKKKGSILMALFLIDIGA